MAFAVYAMAVILAPALGPTLGGFITDNYSWRWIFLINIPVGLISLLLSGRMLSDPPHLVAAKSKAGSVDVIGLALLAIGLGTLEVVLDKGQEDDWFHSGFITAFSLASAVALIAFVVWEWRQEHPVVDVKLFKSRGFATSALMMLILGVCMYSTTVLLPQYLQIWLGYSAFDAGMVLSPGALVLLFIMPLVGWAVAKIDVRYLLAAGFALTAAALFSISQKLYPGIDFGTATLLRVYQMVGMALLFVPINTVAYAGVAPGKNEAVSGIVNLARNLGGDIGISFVNTVIARRSQVHQANLVEHVNRLNPLSSQHIGGMTQHFANQHGSVVDSTRQALAGLYSQVLQQAQTLAYIDTLRALAFVSLITVPFVFTLRKMKPGKAAMAH
jgi:DHA2 family multidrug resistance protein